MSDDEREFFEKLLKRWDLEEFVNPTNETPVPAERFVCWLDPTFLNPILRDAFPKYDSICERLGPRVRFLAYFCFSGEIYLKRAWRSLETEDFYRMGFEMAPNYELLRDFVYGRITRERLKEVFILVMTELKRVLAKKGIMLGKRVGEDATDIRALKHDPEAKYSGYYKESGYKLDIVHDLDQDTLPLDYTPLAITDDEGKCLPISKETLTKIAINPEEWKIDGSYATYPNIADMGMSNIKGIYKIQEGWKFNDKGSPEKIKRRYQTYHKNDDFKVTNNINYMRSYLYRIGDVEYVGAHFRNIAMKDYEANPEEYIHCCNERSGKTEGMMSVVKIETCLDGRLPKRGWNAFVTLADLAMLTFAFGALIRSQNGITTNLGSLTYIT